MSLTPDMYIPVGTVTILKADGILKPELWLLEALWSWRRFVSPALPGEEPSSEPCVPPEVHNQILPLQHFENHSYLLRAGWINMEFSTHSQTSKHASIRVYVLPDDKSRDKIDREDKSLRGKLRRVLQSLDYSPEAWLGSDPTDRDRQAKPLPAHPVDPRVDDASLLWIFNTIPSPRPDPELLTEDCYRDVALDILESRIPGLVTTLYPYQRRSVAYMLQREVNQGHVLDPRLTQVKDQEGHEYYIDTVADQLFKGQQYYPDVSGGILAEEMGSGKTIMCLALILATKDLTTLPDIFYRDRDMRRPCRSRIASLADMAASCARRHHVHWKHHFEMHRRQTGVEFTNCIKILERNPASYMMPSPIVVRTTRKGPIMPRRYLVSSATLAVVPNNLLAQWVQEIRTHTQGLRFLVMSSKKDKLPDVVEVAAYDLILFSQSRLEREMARSKHTPLLCIHFKRCIVDEGHILGNSRPSRKSGLLAALMHINCSSRWVATGTPSRGLFGVDLQETTEGDSNAAGTDQPTLPAGSRRGHDQAELEKYDLGRIGSILSIYLLAKPWAFTGNKDRPSWSSYVSLPRHRPTARGSFQFLRRTLDSVVVRHQLRELNDLLPQVDHRVVVLEGSFQDQLSLNVFSMMVIFNSVQSQRTDIDYFFHPKQKPNLLQLARNLKQACFFGGSFFTHEEIVKAVETAETFLQEKKVLISEEDEQLLRRAIKIGHIAMDNRLRRLSTQFHEMPVSVTKLPAGAGRSWSLDGETEDSLCTSASLLLALQQLIFKATSDQGALNTLLNGQLIQKGLEERERIICAQSAEKPSKSKVNPSQTLAGNTKLGNDSPPKKRSHGVNGMQDSADHDASLGPLEETKITSTISAKLSYLIDSIFKYQDEEKIIVFYENENVAWYLASMLDVLQIQHLIYAKGLSADRRAQYVSTFNQNPAFRVLLMDLSQAAFGLDMREASRIYFITPVLNSQVEAQAIGRVRRISQQKPVSVRTLVLKNSIEEVILERKEHMTQAEHRQTKSMLDVKPIYDWIINAKVFPLNEGHIGNEAQMAPLRTPQYVFGRGFGRAVHPDDGLVTEETTTGTNGTPRTPPPPELPQELPRGVKRPHEGADEPAFPERQKWSATRFRYTADSDSESLPDSEY